MPPEPQTREVLTSVRLAPALEVKLDAGGVAGTVVGYASTFGWPPDSYGEIIAPKAFSRSLAEHRAAGTVPPFLWSHDPSAPVGRWLELHEDTKGLLVKGAINLSTTRGRDAHEHLVAGDVSGLSIGFKPVAAGRTSKGGVVTVTDLDLKEISIVTLPANAGARVTSVKSLQSKRELEGASPRCRACPRSGEPGGVRWLASLDRRN